jgi:hypothetical protein
MGAKSLEIEGFGTKYYTGGSFNCLHLINYLFLYYMADVQYFGEF